MAQQNDYQVNYTIKVDASPGTKQVQEFAESVGKLKTTKQNLGETVTNIKSMMKEIDAVFRASGKKKNQSYTLNINTKDTENKLGRIKGVLGEIDALTKGIKLVIDTGKPLNSKRLKANAKQLIDQGKTDAKQVMTNSLKTLGETQKGITKTIGKINAGLASLEKGRQININTDTAKGRLNELLMLMRQIKGASQINMGTLPGMRNVRAGGLNMSSLQPYVLPEKVAARLQERLYSRNQLHQQRLAEREQMAAARLRERDALANARRVEQERQRKQREQDNIRKKVLEEEKRRERDAEKQRQRDAASAVRGMQRQAGMENSIYGGRRKAAINRMQYSKAPTMRNMPFAYMFNAYMGYSLMRRQLTEAVEYSNIMQTAHSILKVSDSDLSTFENRFDNMAKNVRKIGVETKFTAIEVAGAVKYLSMAGMGIETINQSIRPITNLALIGDNDISQIADLATNIMAGYNIKSSSMGSVADILASTVSRSNVNIIEMAESYKMAAGYMQLAGVDFSESSAAIGILGNMGVKGTMGGTALRAMATRFAKPTKEAQRTMDKLGVKFTQYHNIYGNQVEKLKPLADIFEELNKKGATLADMQTIFGKIGGNAAMMFLENYDKLRELASQNRVSHGISDELAKVKQDTTKGLWFQMTSQFSESFMQGFELLEPQIRSLLRDFLGKFQTKEFAQGLASVGRTLLDIFSTLGSIATWFTTNFHWIEPVLFTGFVATKLFKLAGAVTNLGVAVGFLGKQSAASSTMQLISNLSGFGGIGGIGRLGKMSMANKRAIVSALSAAGVSGKGAMTRALAQGGGSAAMLARTGATGLFASQVATGNGLIGAGASIGALGAGAIAATAGIAGLVGVMGWLAYKTWKVKEAKDAVLDELKENRKYRYPSIEALQKSLFETYKEAVRTKKAVDDVTAGKTLEEESGLKIGAFTSKWWMGIAGEIGASFNSRGGNYAAWDNTYTTRDAYQDDVRAAINVLAEKDGQNKINSAWAKFSRFTQPWEVDAFIQNIEKEYGIADKDLDHSLFTYGKDGIAIYKKGMDKVKASQIALTPDYQKHTATEIIPSIRSGAVGYRNAISSYGGAKAFIEKTGFSFTELEKSGFFLNKKGLWEEKMLPKNTTDTDRSNQLAKVMDLQSQFVTLTSVMRKNLGGSGEAVENIMRMAGIPYHLYANEPQSNNMEPFNSNGITNSRPGADDGMAGGNYSGTGKLSSAAPKQVIVNISNLMSVATIDLMKSKEGQTAEIQDLKDQLAQALIDVVHDFDASWNG